VDDRRRRRTASITAPLVAVLTLAAALGGCGVPTSSEVQYVGPGPTGGGGLPGTGELPPTPDDAATPQELVENYLEAPAGNLDTALERVEAYVRDTDQGRWSPEPEVRVVRVLELFDNPEAQGGSRIELTVQQVGILDRTGYLDPVTGGETSYRFQVVREGGPEDGIAEQSPRYRLADPPPVLLLADTALTDTSYYFPTPIYFWDSDHEVLVPDLRWLPLAGEQEATHPWIVLQWLLGGPAPSLSRLQGLPGGTQPVGTPRWEGEDDSVRLVVNLNAAARGEWEVNDLATQLAWSLLQLRPGADLELRIDDQLQEHLATGPPAWAQAEPVRLAVLDGVIRPFAGDQPATFPALSGDVNSGVLAAALTGQGRLAALVREEPGSGRQRLSVVEAAEGGEPAETPTRLVASDIGQPTWLRAGETGLGLVVAGGQLHRFTAGGEAAAVSVPGLAGPVTAVAVAPEGRRVALVADGGLYVASIQLDGDAVVVDDLRAVPTTVERLTGVAFSHENRLVVAGEKGDRVGLHALTVDGGLEDTLRELSNAPVTSLVAHPLRDTLDWDVMYEADGLAFTYRGAQQLVDVEELANPPEDTDSSPRSPFFLD
jgi:hypothetical protein